MTPYELIELISKYYSIEDTIEITNDLIGQINSDAHRFIVKLSEEVELLALDYDRCPLCGSKLETTEHTENRGEYQGIECTEIIYTRECSECSYIVE